MVYLAPYNVAEITPGPPSLYVSAQHTWIGPDGSEWDLSEGLSGVRLMKGVRGLLNPTHTRYSRKSPGRAGSQYAGSVTDERSILWPLKVFKPGGSTDWIAHNDRFWQTMDRDQPGTWKVTQPGDDNIADVTRWIKCRFDSLVDDAVDDDPGLYPWFTYGINLVADEDPYWRGTQVSRTFVAAVGQNFYGGAAGNGKAPLYYISNGATTANASISNLGDVPTSPIIKVTGPTTNVTVGIGGHNISFPMTLLAGQTRTIDTDASDQTCYDENGNDVTSQLGVVDFFEVPKGTNVPLAIAISGTGSVTVSLTPGYFRAKGVN